MWMPGDAIFCRRWRDAERPRFWRSDGGVQLHGGAEERRGYKWALGLPLSTSMTAVLPPNREICLWWHVRLNGVVPPSSRHQGGCHVLIAEPVFLRVGCSADLLGRKGLICIYW